MQQQIIINVTDSNGVGVPNTGLSGLIDTISGAAANHLGFIIAVALLTILITLGVVIARNGVMKQSRKTRIGFLSLFLIPIAIFAIATTNSAQAITDLTLTTNGDQTITVVQGETKTGTLTTTVSTTNPTGYLLTAKIDQTGLDTLTNNNIALTLTGGDIANLDITSLTPNQAEELLETNAPANNQATNFTVTVSVPATIAVGTYAVNLTYDATDNAPNTPTTMQTMTADFCTNYMSVYPDTTNGPNTITLTDTRNGQDYDIRKLADNKCWMIDNLKYELSNGLVLSPTTTNVATDTTIWFTQDGTQTGTPLTGMTGNFTTSGFNTRDNTNSSIAPNFDAWRQNNPNTTSWCSTTTNLPTGSKTGCGYLYNFYTVTAGTAPQSQTTNGSTASGSICPANWRLPTGYNASGDFGQLDIAYGGTGASQSGTPAQLSTLWLSSGAWRGLLFGYYFRGFDNQGYYGTFWSSSVNSASNGYYTLFNPSSVSPGTNTFSRYYGMAVRCVLD